MLDTDAKRRIATARDILVGKQKFFTGDYVRYGWAKLMALARRPRNARTLRRRHCQDARKPRHHRQLSFDFAHLWPAG